MTQEEVELKLEAAREAEDRGDYTVIETIVDEAVSCELSELQNAEVLRLLGIVTLKRGDSELAIERLQSAEFMAEHLEDRRLIARISSSIGSLHFKHSAYTEALVYFERSLALHEELGDKPSVARAANNVGLVYRVLSNYTKAVEYFLIALSIFEEMEEKSGIALATSNIGIVYRHLAEYSKALEYLEGALALFEELGEHSRAAAVTTSIGSVYRNLSDYYSALKFFDRALLLSEELGEKSNIAVVIGNIGNVYGILSDYQKALEYFTRALALHEELGEKSGYALVMGRLGNVYLNLSDYSKALECYERALFMHQELREKSGTALIINCIGIVYGKLLDYAKALENYKHALALYEGLGEKYGIAVVTGCIGELYATPEYSGYNAVKAEECLTMAVSMFEEIGTKKDLYDSHKIISKFYEHEGNIENAFQHYKRYHELEKEVFSEDAKKKAEQLDYQRKEAEREKQRAVIKARDEERIASQEGLLNRILPPSIAQRLLKGERVADYYRDISILFADIVGFTPISAQMPAHVVVKFLNYVFGVFDSIMKEHGCEKIKTIGDGYMAVSGAPIECADHAERIAAAAIAMQRDILLPDDIREHIEEGTVFNIRIGIHAGSAVGGIIGDERFVFDVYSDAVNFAARMEQSSEPGKIHVSTDFAMHLQNRMNQTGGESPFKLVRRGQVEIKGKGAVKTYWLEQV